jgi:hypothetical protein
MKKVYMTEETTSVTTTVKRRLIVGRIRRDIPDSFGLDGRG